jgi:hypothetical protein
MGLRMRNQVSGYVGRGTATIATGARVPGQAVVRSLGWHGVKVRFATDSAGEPAGSCRYPAGASTTPDPGIGPAGSPTGLRVQIRSGDRPVRIAAVRLCAKIDAGGLFRDASRCDHLVEAMGR